MAVWHCLHDEIEAGKGDRRVPASSKQSCKAELLTLGPMIFHTQSSAYGNNFYMATSSKHGQMFTQWTALSIYVTSTFTYRELSLPPGRSSQPSRSIL